MCLCVEESKEEQGGFTQNLVSAGVLLFLIIIARVRQEGDYQVIVGGRCISGLLASAFPYDLASMSNGKGRWNNALLFSTSSLFPSGIV